MRGGNRGVLAVAGSGVLTGVPVLRPRRAEVAAPFATPLAAVPLGSPIIRTGEELC